MGASFLLLVLALRVVIGAAFIALGTWILFPVFLTLKEALMRIAVILPILALSACANIPGYPPAAAQNERCFVQTVKEAFDGNFSNWVLPDFVPGTHLKAGQLAPCMAK